MINLQTRELVLNWTKDGKTQQQIADLIGSNQSSISRLIAKYKKTGKKNADTIPCLKVGAFTVSSFLNIKSLHLQTIMSDINTYPNCYVRQI